jgi:hypothetical protein
MRVYPKAIRTGLVRAAGSGPGGTMTCDPKVSEIDSTFARPVMTCNYKLTQGQALPEGPEHKGPQLWVTNWMRVQTLHVLERKWMTNELTVHEDPSPLGGICQLIRAAGSRRIK